MATFLKDVFQTFLCKNISFLWFGSLEIKSGISYSSYSENSVCDITQPEVHRRSAEMAPRCSYTFRHYFSLYVKSLALKLTKKMRFFRNIHECDHLWPSLSPQVTGHGAKWKTIYKFLSMNNCNYRPIWYRYWDIDMQHFCNHGYIFERRFSPIFCRNVSLLWLGH